MFEVPQPTRHPVLTKHRNELFIALQRLVPHHLLSRLAGKLADSNLPWLKRCLIRLAMKHYKIELGDAIEENPENYATFNDFFTRRLKPSARPVDSRELALVSPSDGVVSQAGDIQNGTLIQAKGREFTVNQLLGLPPAICEQFYSGSFATIYLAPHDYHRVHMPVDGVLSQTRYIPGTLFSVNSVTADGIDNLFSRNERLVTLFNTGQGTVAVVLVGALLVAGIETVWQKNYLPGRVESRQFSGDYRLAKGEEMGLFKFGSTVIVLTEKKLCWQEEKLAEATICRMGEQLGSFESGTNDCCN